MSDNTTTDLQPDNNHHETSKTRKNRKYRHHQKEKRIAGKQERIEKIFKLNEEKDALLRENERLRLKIEEKDRLFNEVSDLWQAAETRVKEIEFMLKEKTEGIFIADPDLNF